MTACRSITAINYRNRVANYAGAAVGIGIIIGNGERADGIRVEIITDYSRAGEIAAAACIRYGNIIVINKNKDVARIQEDGCRVQANRPKIRRPMQRWRRKNGYADRIRIATAR